MLQLPFRQGQSKAGAAESGTGQRHERHRRQRRASTCTVRGRRTPPAAPQAKLRPLRLLVPYVMRYRGRAAAALVALLVAAVTTLVVPVAVRRMIDFGFDAEHIGLIDQYFGVMIAVVAVLALASASRYYLVTTLGERVVADLRAAVFGHLDLALGAVLRHRARPAS